MILLDTHVLVWMASEPKQLSRRAPEAIRKARQPDIWCVAEEFEFSCKFVGEQIW